ncbi:MAG: prolipoprotein diacylglyceryl transferase family protein [Candidatus Promineifilaceae bacterium]
MRPVLFQIGSLPIFAYGVFVLLGSVLLFIVALGLARRAGYSWEQLIPVALGVMVGSVFGARLSHLLVEPGRLSELLDFYSLFRPGTPGNILGLIVGGFLGGMVLRYRFDLPSQGNFYAPAIAAASVVWRIGCTLAGCCHGTATSLPWAIHLHGETVHPTMIYEGLLNLGLLIILWRVKDRSWPDNALMYFYLAVYCLFRFWLEFIRLYPPVLWGLTGIQWLCLAILSWTGLWWLSQHRIYSPQA